MKHGKILLASLAAMLGLTTALSGCASSPQSSPGQTVTIQYNPTVFSWLGIIAKKAGMFEKNGVNAELKQIDNGTLATTALAGGQVTLAFQDLSLVAPYLNKGEQFTAVSGTGKLSWDVVAPKGTVQGSYPQSVKALEGKKVGVPALGSVAYYYARAYLKDAGVDPDKVQFVAVGAFAQVPSVIASRQVDAAVVTPDQTYQLEKTVGVDVLFSATKDRSSVDEKLQKVIGTPGSYYFAQSSWASSNGPLVEKVQKSLAQADVWAHDPANLAALTDDLDSTGLLPKALSTPEAKRDFVAYAIGFMSAEASAADLQAYVDFWKDNKVLTANVDGKSLISGTAPATASAVAALAQ